MVENVKNPTKVLEIKLTKKKELNKMAEKKIEFAWSFIRGKALVKKSLVENKKKLKKARKRKEESKKVRKKERKSLERIWNNPGGHTLTFDKDKVREVR